MGSSRVTEDEQVAAGRRERFRGSRIGYVVAVTVTIVLSLILWLLRDHLTDANFSLLYILEVLLIAVQFGTGPSLLAAALAFFAFNFLLLQPFYSLTVADPRELLDLLIFLIVAVIAGQMTAYARRQAANADQRTYEQEVLFRLTSAFNQLTVEDEVYRVLQQVLRDDLRVLESEVLPGRQSHPGAGTLAYVLLEANHHIYGTLRVRFDAPPDALQLRMLRACAAQAAAALMRLELTARAQQSRTFEEADRLKTALLHAVSHDLRTPITIIKSSANNLVHLQAKLAPEEQREMLVMIEREADQLNGMVEDLLDMSRLRAGALKLNQDWCSLEEIAGDVTAAAWQRLRQERIRLSFADDFPLVWCDYGLMLRALSNLVENALRYEPAETQVEIAGTATETVIGLSVINHGPNIPASERDLIMQPFYHGQDGHIGLGLAIAKGIIEAHGGQLAVADTPDGGATFTCTLVRRSANET